MSPSSSPSRAAADRASPAEALAQINDLDWQRIVGSLAQRARYRYVLPLVEREAGGYRIVSPCCSRNVDASGASIDIARLEFDRDGRRWQLFSKNHAENRWELRAQGDLNELLVLLNQDPQRVFWQ
jgi:hypothetical protein